MKSVPWSLGAMPGGFSGPLPMTTTRWGHSASLLPDRALESAEHEAPLFAQLCAASIRGGAALAPESSSLLARLGQRRPPRPPPLPGSLCADRDGFSLHAKVLVPVGEPISYWPTRRYEVGIRIEF